MKQVKDDFTLKYYEATIYKNRVKQNETRI